MEEGREEGGGGRGKAGLVGVGGRAFVVGGGAGMVVLLLLAEEEVAKARWQWWMGVCFGWIGWQGAGAEGSVAADADAGRRRSNVVPLILAQ